MIRFLPTQPGAPKIAMFMKEMNESFSVYFRITTSILSPIESEAVLQGTANRCNTFGDMSHRGMILSSNSIMTTDFPFSSERVTILPLNVLSTVFSSDLLLVVIVSSFPNIYLVHGMPQLKFFYE